MRQKEEENEEMLWVSCEVNLIMTLRSLKKTIGINEKFINIEKDKKKSLIKKWVQKNLNSFLMFVYVAFRSIFTMMNEYKSKNLVVFCTLRK